MGCSLSYALLALALLAANNLLAEANSDRDCYGSVGGANGHIYQFDGGHVTTFSRGCCFLLARGGRGTCKFDLYATFSSSNLGYGRHYHFETTRLVALTVKYGRKVYELQTGRRLFVDGKPINVLYSEPGVRVFFSGEDLVLVLKKCDLWVTFDGAWTATFRLGSRYRRHVSGLAGNCDGNRWNDNFGHLSKAYRLWKRKGWVKGCRKRFRLQTCQGEHERREARKACQKVIQGQGSSSNSAVLKPCIIDYCSTRYRPDFRKQVLCANFYLYSRHCAHQHRPLAWRHKSGCLLKCGRHQHFSRKASSCPKTCENHFFGTKQFCFKLPSSEGCRCNNGYVLDGSRCVKPEQCECLENLCIDRISTKKCRRWKFYGRCRRYPEVMGRFCRLTCGMCAPSCHNQISTLLCEKLKRQGKCRVDFYRMMCQSTCQPHKCGCPSPRVVVSKCTHKYKNKAITSLRWYPDQLGRCKKSVFVRFRACGSCRYRSKISWRKGNYCTGLQYGKRVLQYREKYGQRRCIHRVLSLRRRCRCPAPGRRKRVSTVKCQRNHILVRITKTYKVTKRCTLCRRVTQHKVIKKIKCGGRFYTGKCRGNVNHITRKQFERYAHNCRCLTRQVSRHQYMCRCNKPTSRTFCKGNYFLKETTNWTLKKGRCNRGHFKKKLYILCQRRPRTWKTCQRKTCDAFLHKTYFKVHGCKCRKQETRKLLGKCCCPPGIQYFEPVDRYWKNLIITFFELKNYRCYKKRIVRRIRIACPKGRHFEQCDGRRGARIFVKQWYLKQGNNCAKKQEAREVKIKCQQDVKRKEGKCHLLDENVRYRVVEFHFLRRRPGSCDCVGAKRTVKEVCGCREGRFTRLTKCPRGCSARRCGNDCTFAKEFYYFKRYNHQCRPHVFKRLDFRCCCRPDRRVKVWCRDNHTTMQEISYSVLKSHRCHRVRSVSSKRVQCKRRAEIKKEKHHKKRGFYFLVRFEWYVSKCKCRVRVNRKECRSYCDKPSKSHFCDTVRRQWIHRSITWSLHKCKYCVRRLHDRRVPVRCSQSIKRWKHCDKRTGILTNYKQWFEQLGCYCKRRQSSTKLRCQCPKPVVGQRRCNQNRNAFEKKITYWELSNGRCRKKVRIARERVICSQNVRRKTKCNDKKGVRVIYNGIMRPKRCTCVRKWSKRTTRYRCNCKRENRRVRHVRRKFCDRRWNLKGIMRFFFVLRRGKCIKQTRQSLRGFRCPRPYHERLRCNEARRRQLVLKHFFVKRNCRCVRLVQRRYRKCGCRGKKLVRKHFCRKVRGVLVQVVIRRRWNHQYNYCVVRVGTISHRVLCRARARYIVGKCIKNEYYVERRVFFVRKGCRCIRKEKRQRRNCHCKDVIRRFKCPRTGFSRREVTEIRRWNMKKRRCLIMRYVTRRIRCRCPKGFERKYCKAGKWVNESTRFVLRDARCYKKIDNRTYPVHCKRIVRQRITACKGCTKFHYTLEQRLHPARCACYFAVVRKRRCPCCCPKNTNKRRCASDDRWEHEFTNFAVETGKKCGCRKWIDRKHDKVRCSTKKHLRWQQCNRRTCTSHQQVIYEHAKDCRCRKVQKLTGRKRVCCCLTRPQTSRYCRNSTIFERRVFSELKNWRCVQKSTERKLHHWSCNRKAVIKVGRCNRANCLQSVHTLADEVSRPHCRCRQVIRNRHMRRCCCLMRPKKSTSCVRNCWAQMFRRYIFDNRRRICICLVTRKRWCVDCPRPKLHIKKCNRRTCKQQISRESYELTNCTCKKRIDITHKTCCCAPPTVSGPICRKHKQQVWLHISYRLSHGSCMREEKETRRLVVCRRGERRELRCDRRTCLQGIRHETLRAHNCRCRSLWRETKRTCCCRPAVRTNIRCEQDRFLFQYKTTRTLSLSYSCVSRTTKHLLNEVRNCRTYERRGHCNKKTRKVIVHIFYQKPKGCKCDLYRKSTRHVLCRCPGPRERTSKCDKKTCHLNVVKEWYTSQGSGDHFKCQKHLRTKTLRCCCHRNPSHRTYCDKKTGYFKREDVWSIFQTHSRKCIKRRSDKIVHKPVCPKNTCHTGKCNRSTGFKVRKCVYFYEERHNCRCKRNVIRRNIVCSCPKGYRKTFCQGNSRRITLITNWVISRRLNRCIRRVRRYTRHLNCPRESKKTRKCHGCRGIESTYQYFIHRCRCYRKTRSRRVLCCCPKSHALKRCMGGYWLTESVRYKLRNNRCIKVLDHKKLVVACRKMKTIRSKCRGCVKRKEILHFRVRECQCRLSRRIVRKDFCCCSGPRSFVHCRGGSLTKVHESWTLSLGKCIKRREVSVTKVRCKHTTEKAFKCNRRTRRRKLVITKFIRYGCKCVRRQRVRYIRCLCRNAIIKAEKCGRSSKRRVLQIKFKLVQENDQYVCHPRRSVLYWEPCRCPRTRRSRKCATNGKVFITTERSWKLVKHHGRNVCAQKVKLLHTLVKCEEKYVIWSKCRDFRKYRSVIQYLPKNCKCRRKVFKQLFACNCALRSFNRNFCDPKRGEMVTIQKLFFLRRDSARCSSVTRKIRKPVQCSRLKQRSPVSPECEVSHRNGWYTKYLVTWMVRRGCKCVSRHKTVLELCSCNEDWECERCGLTGQYQVTIEHKHERIGSTCHLTRTIHRTPVLCSDSEPKIHYDGCNSNCLRQVSFSQCYVRNCQTHYYEKSGLQRCCTPPPRKRRYCDKSNGRWVTDETTYHLVKSGTLIRNRDGMNVVPKFKVVSQTRRSFLNVQCQRSQLNESCNKRDGKWKKAQTTWRRVGCECKKKVQRWSGVCKCPPKQVRWSRCANRYKVETVIYFELKQQNCVRRVQRRSYLCACSKPHSFTRCDGHGHWATCHISYQLQFRKQRCVKKQRCQNRPHTCPGPREISDRCVHFSRRINRSVWVLDKRSCKCNRKIHKRRADCDCHKRRSHHTVCKHGALVTRFIYYIQRGEKCLKSVKDVAKPVYCNGKHRRRVVSNSCVKGHDRKRLGYQKVLTEWDENHECRCVRKHTVSWVPCLCHLIKQFRTRKSVNCVRGSVLLYTTIRFKLVHERCVRKVYTHEQKIQCKGTKERHEKCRRNRDGDTYAITRIFHKVSNGRCGCVWKQRSLRYRICKCRKRHHSRRCLRDQTWHSEYFSYVRVPGAPTCRGSVKRHDKQIHCRKPFTKKTKCRGCRFTVRYYNYKHHNCKCVAKLQSTQVLRCCCAKPTTKHTCDTRRHLKVAVTVTNILRNHACHRNISVRTQRVHCGRKRPHYRESACIKGYRKIFKTVQIAVGCNCRPKTTVHKQRCSCSPERIYRRGKCGQWFAQDSWLAFKLMPTGKYIPKTNKPIMHCVRYVAHKTKRRCRCPKGYERRQCKNENIKVHVRVTYRIRNNSCQRSHTVREQRLPCSKRLRLVSEERLPRKCSKRNGYIQTLRFHYVSAKRCRCIRRTRQRKRICDCLRKYGRQTKKQCIGHNREVTIVTWKIPKGDGCERRTNRSVRVVQCRGNRTNRGKCGRNNLRTYTIYKRKAHNCGCAWQRVRRITVPCRCHKSVVTVRCTGNHWETLTKSWRLVGSGFNIRCKSSKKVRRRRVPCEVGSYVRKSRCNFLGLRNFVKTTRTLRKCQCLEKERRHTCRCRCNKPQTRRFCENGRVWVTVRVTSTLKNCACVGKSALIRKRVRCPRSRRVRGPCRRGKDGDKYRTITRIRWVVSRCKCRRIRSVRRILCSCDRRRRVHHWCLGGYFRAAKITVRRLKYGRCRRERIGWKLRRVQCGRVRVRRVCHRKSGRLSIFVTRSYIRRCRCFRRVKRHIRRCGCHKGSKLVSIGRCNRETCRQRLLFKKQVLRYEKCKWRRYHKHRVCCCRGHKHRVRCQRNEGLVVTTITKRVLKNWRCVRKVVRKRRRVTCKRNTKVRQQKLSHGILKVTRCWKVRRGCQCVKRCETTFKRYRCDKPKQQTFCKCTNIRCRQVKRITSWRLSHGRCLRQIRRSRHFIVCKPNTASRTPCDKRTQNGFYYVETLVYWHVKSCRCRKEVRRRSVVCRCLKPHNATFCHHGRIERVRTSYRLSHGRCVKSLKRRSRVVRCNESWRLSHRTSGNPVYYKVFERFVLFGCQCVRQTKRVRCQSQCPSCSVKTFCEQGNFYVRVQTCWRREDCRCIKKVHTTRKHVRCPGTSSRRHCRRCVQTVVTSSYSIRRCKCVLYRKTSRRKCCCPRPKVTQTCIRGSIRVRRVSFELKLGSCFSRTKDAFNVVYCSRRVDREIHGKCKRGKQIYNVHYWIKLGCRCVRRVRQESRKCACSNKAIDLYLLLDIYHGCKNNYEKSILKFVRTTTNLFEDKEIKVRTMLVASYRSQTVIKKLDHIKEIPFKLGANSKITLVGGLRAILSYLTKQTKRGVHKSVLIFTCGKHTNKQHSIELAEKLQRLKYVTVTVVAFMPPAKAIQYLKLLSSNPHKENFFKLNIKKKYRIHATRLFERICKRSCAKPFVRRFACQRSSCRREFKRTTFHFDQRKGKCVRKNSSWWELCCCLDRNRSDKECIRNKLFQVEITHKFEKHSCHRKVYRRDISAAIFASCRPRVSHKKGKCQRNGWRQDIKETRKVINCRCRLYTERQLVRCRCPKPHESVTCQRDNRIRHCSTTYSLTRRACIAHRCCRSTRINCQQSRTVKGKCDRFSCLRDMGRVWYTLENCRCKRHHKNWREICCCHRQYQKVPHCDKRRNEHVETESWLEFFGAGCRRIYRRRARPVHCPGRKIEHTQCVAKKNGFYRYRLEREWRKSDCGCNESIRRYLELCRCRRGRTTKKCRSGSWVLTHHWLEKSGNRCIPRTEVVSRQRVTCSARRHNRTGRCHQKKGDRFYAQVVQTWKRRVGCACKTARKVFLKLCGCPKPFRRTSCRGNSKLVITTYSYKLSGNHCDLRKSSTIRVVHCRRPHRKLSKCRGKTQAVIVTLQTAQHCKCKSKVYRHTVRCKAKCKDHLPTKICRKWASGRIRLCDKHPHLARSLCALSCHLCYDCPTTKIVFAGQFCLSKQLGFSDKFILKTSSSFEQCVRSCKQNSKCRAVDYENPTRKCRLLRVHRAGLLIRLPKLKLRETPDCILFERICPKKCNFRRILKGYRCRCIKFGKRHLCYRKSDVATWRRDRSGRCKKRIQRIRVPCRRCEDNAEWCNKSKCSQQLVRSLCNYTCRVCKRKPMSYFQRGHCSKRGWLVETRARVFFDKVRRLWRVQISNRRMRCVRCPVGSYELVGQCKNGKRKLTRVVAHYTRGHCRITAHTKSLSCRGCSLATSELVGKCKRRGQRWIRLVITQYTVRLAGRCVVRSSVVKFCCSPKCPRNRVSHSKCMSGKRIRCVHYTVTYPGFKVCVPKKYTTIERCVSVQRCQDVFRPIDCLFVKKNRMCKSMRSWCSKTCGVCR